jgi:hypothetical protein
LGLASGSSTSWIAPATIPRSSSWLSLVIQDLLPPPTGLWWGTETQAPLACHIVLDCFPCPHGLTLKMYQPGLVGSNWDLSSSLSSRCNHWITCFLLVHDPTTWTVFEASWAGVVSGYAFSCSTAGPFWFM